MADKNKKEKISPLPVIGGMVVFFGLMIAIIATNHSQTTIPDFNYQYEKEYLLGQFVPSEHPDFVLIDSAYTTKSSAYLREEAYQSFLEMRNAAAEEGLELIIVSATRNFDYQKLIWEAKWNGYRYVGGKNLAKTITDPEERALEILKYSSMPGTSRHHWGTDIDLNSLENSYFGSGVGLKVYQWLTNHAYEYGYYLVYTEKNELRPSGYEEEKWHWTYLPLSWEMLHQYTNLITHQDISGFDGDEAADDVNMIDNYVMGINPECIQFDSDMERFYE